jgi:hypothetical protein
MKRRNDGFSNGTVVPSTRACSWIIDAQDVASPVALVNRSHLAIPAREARNDRTIQVSNPRPFVETILRVVATFCVTALPVIQATSHAQSILVDFDSIPAGEIGDRYVPNPGVRFFVGNGPSSTSNGLLLLGGQPVSARVGSFGTSISGPNVLVPRPGTNEDIWVHFYGKDGQRVAASSFGVQNDTEGNPSQLWLEGFNSLGVSLGRTTINGARSTGTFSASGIWSARISGAPGFGGLLGVDNFRFDFCNHISQHPQSAAACPTRIAVLNVSALGSGPFTYQWRKDGTPIDSLTNPSAATATLTLSNIGPIDVASYDCIVSNACGSVTSNAAALTLAVKCSVADIVGTDGGPVQCADSTVDGSDFIAFINSFSIGDAAIDPLADIAGGGDTGEDPDGTIDGTDFIAFINAFAIGC